VDIACMGEGKEVLAVSDGYVVHADWWPSSSQKNHLLGHGLTVVIHHTDQQGANKEVRAQASQWFSIPTAIPWDSILLVAGLGILCLVLRSIGLTYRTQAALVGLGLLLYAWAIPSLNTWLTSPFADVAFKVIDTYGDVRTMVEGQTAQIYSVPPGTEVRSVVDGQVIEVPSIFSVQGNQVWLKVGNGLYVQYAGLSEIKVLPGQKIRAGEVVGFSSDKFRLGISSKAPDLFTNLDDRSYGWVNPEKYLGQTLLSGVRQEESNALEGGLILLILALFWPSNYLKRLVARLQLDLVAPYGSDWFYARSRLLVASASTMAVALVFDSPWLKWIAIVPLAISAIYFYDRSRVRKRLKNRQRINIWWSHFAHQMMSSIWVSWVFFLLLGGLLDPNLTYANNIDYQLDLPSSITPPLPADLDHPEIVLNSNLPEFNTIYWNGSETKFWIDPEVWAANVAAWKKYPWCDPRHVTVIEHSESPRYSNHVYENAATAAGTGQFIKTTWESVFSCSIDAGTCPKRTDRYATAEAICRYIKENGMVDSINQSEAAYVNDFAVESPVWNMYPPQAKYVWRVYHELVKVLPLPVVEIPK
jgi:hypothetical protein